MYTFINISLEKRIKMSDNNLKNKKNNITNNFNSIFDKYNSMLNQLENDITNSTEINHFGKFT